MKEWMLAEPIVVIISLCMSIKPSYCMPETYIVIYVNYLLIKLGKEISEHDRKGELPA